MKNYPLVSVIIPVYNRENLIKKSIDSVLCQTYKNLEVIIIDDESTDNTGEVVKQINDERIKYYKNEKNLGPSGSRNKGIELSEGEFIAFQDSDDEWKMDKLEKQVILILNSPGSIAAVYCGMEFIDNQTGEKIGENLREVNFRENFTKGSYFLTPSTQTVIIKRNVIKETGYFDERLFAQEDTELAIRISKKYDYAFVNESLVKVTRNHEQLMSNSQNYILSREIIYDKHKDYLSSKILFGSCKQIANFYILNNNYEKASGYLKKSMKYKFELTTMLLYYGIIFTPFLIKRLYSKKYKGNIPLSSGLKVRNQKTKIRE